MEPDIREVKAFLKVLIGLAGLWLILGGFITSGPFGHDPSSTFLRLFLVSNAGLAALIVLFWKLFFSKLDGFARKVDLLIWFVFKLVCWGFLAITLKRLTNATGLELFLGVGFVALGPLMAGCVVHGISRFKGPEL